MADSDIFSFLHQVQLDSEANAQSETTLGKRTRGTDSADEDEDIDESGSQANTGNGDATTLIESEETPWEVSLPSAQLNQNVVAFARQAGAARKLNDDHLRLLEKFAKARRILVLLPHNINPCVNSPVLRDGSSCFLRRS